MLPDHVRSSPRSAFEDKYLKCPKCGGRAHFDLLYFLNIDDWPDFPKELAAHPARKAHCEGCGHSMEIRSPLIVEIPTHNILVFVTHARDDGGVNEGFRTVLERAAQVVDPAVLEIAKTRPYAFVHGWAGLVALLRALDGLEWVQPSPPYSHDIDDREAIVRRDGFLHGSLFFYDPAQHAVGRIVQTLLQVSADAQSVQRAKTIRGIMLRCIDVIGESHPWLVQEVGRLSLMADDSEVAALWLEKALRAQHRWITPTSSFLDATPTRRSDGATQADHLPHTNAAQALGDVSQQRHSVVQHYPRTKDYGLWYFPIMERAAVPSEYTLLAAMLVHGRLLASLELELESYREGERLGAFAFQSVGVLRYEILTLLDEIEAHGGSPGDRLAFWEEYIRVRWNVDLSNAGAERQDDDCATAQAITSTLREIERRANELPDDSDETFLMLFDARIGVSIRHLRRFGWSCTQHLRRELNALLELHRDDQSGDSIPFRSVDTVVAEFRDFVRICVRQEEVRDLLMCYAPVVCYLLQCSASSNDNDMLLLQAHIRHMHALIEMMKGEAAISVVGALSRSADAFAGIGVAHLSQMTQAALDQARHASPAGDDQYSRYEIHKLSCSVCQRSADYLVWNVANAMSRPAIKNYVKAGVVHQIYCQHCGSSIDRPIPLLYCSPDEDKFFFWAPPGISTPSAELTDFVFAYFSSLPIKMKAGRPRVAVVDQYIEGWQHAEECAIVSKVCDGEQFFSLVNGSTQSLRAPEDAGAGSLPKHADLHTQGLASTPHPEADPAGAARLNLDHIQAMAEWKALPAWKRILRKKPVRPTEI